MNFFIQLLTCEISFNFIKLSVVNYSSSFSFTSNTEFPLNLLPNFLLAECLRFYNHIPIKNISSLLDLHRVFQTFIFRKKPEKICPTSNIASILWFLLLPSIPSIKVFFHLCFMQLFQKICQWFICFIWLF